MAFLSGGRGIRDQVLFFMRSKYSASITFNQFESKRACLVEEGISEVVNTLRLKIPFLALVTIG